MSGEKIQRYAPGHWAYPNCKLDTGEYVLHADVLAALASRDATIKTQGEEIAELRASVERLRGALTTIAGMTNDEDLHGNDALDLIAANAKDALAPGAKGARELEQ